MAMSEKGITIRLDQATADKCDYWYKKQGFTSRTAFVKAAIERYIAFANGDYQLPSAEVARLNQLISAQKGTAAELQSLRKSFDKATQAFLNLSDSSLTEPNDME